MKPRRRPPPSSPTWWQRGVIYHIYPRSFLDTNGDGIGDLRGIARGLAYLEWLGVNALWISPIYPSPMADCGYDITDHTGIDPCFGTLADFDLVLAEAHRRNLKVILDYVPNHTSDRHPWFVASRSARRDPHRDWYVWCDPAPGGGPPNNWRSVFGGSAWTWDARTAQYYYHAYLPEQPDLNSRHPAVRDAMLDVLRFWLDRGVDGFRVDALRQLVEDRDLRDNPANPDHDPRRGPYHALLPVYTTDRPETLEMLALMRRLIDRYPERLLIGELYLPIERLVAYYGVAGTGAHLPANFHLILVEWCARRIAELIATYEAALPVGAWPNWVLGNHDQPRVASRIGSAQARAAAMLLLTLRGTPTMYFGDEIGMRNVAIPPAEVQDPWEKNVPGLGLGRDPQRTPMQWDARPNAGFTTGRPWLPLAADAEVVNVASQRDDPASILTLYRRLLALRRERPALAVGGYETVEASGGVLAYARGAGPGRCLIALNLGDASRRLAVPAAFRGGHILLSTGLDRADERATSSLELRGAEGVIVSLSSRRTIDVMRTVSRCLPERSAGPRFNQRLAWRAKLWRPRGPAQRRTLSFPPIRRAGGTRRRTAVTRVGRPPRYPHGLRPSPTRPMAPAFSEPGPLASPPATSWATTRGPRDRAPRARHSAFGPSSTGPSQDKDLAVPDPTRGHDAPRPTTPRPATHRSTL